MVLSAREGRRAIPNHHTRKVPEVSQEQREELQRWLRRRDAAQALALRARIILESAEGMSDQAVARALGTTRATAGKRRRAVVTACWTSRGQERRVWCRTWTWSVSWCARWRRCRAGLPLRPGWPRQQMHDYKRNGTTSLFAALNTATGEVISRVSRQHRSVEFKKFLAIIDKAVLAELDIHLVLDNYSTHKTAMIHNWLLCRPRFDIYFTPTSASWMHQVERWLAETTRECTRCETFPGTQALGTAITEDLNVDNDDPKPLVWATSADQILESLRIYCETISGAED